MHTVQKCFNQEVENMVHFGGYSKILDRNIIPIVLLLINASNRDLWICWIPRKLGELFVTGFSKKI